MDKKSTIVKKINELPREKVLFLPTPYHKLENLSEKYNVSLYMKREDMSGPSNFGGNKTRKLEFILGEAVKNNVEYIISYGGYQTNSGMEMVAFARKFGIKPILYLADMINQGEPDDYKGNLLLTKLMDCELNFVLKESNESTDINEIWNQVKKLSFDRKQALEKQEHKALVLEGGCITETSIVSYVLAFKEIIEQSEINGTNLDYIFHTTGTGGSLPGLIAGKLLFDSKVKIVSIAINPYGPEDICNEDIIYERIKQIYELLDIPIPSKKKVKAEINIDQNYIGEDYGIPSNEGLDAIRELATMEGLFIDPVYSGKGFAGLLDYIINNKVPKKSSIAFIHTGGSGALFAEKKLTGELINLKSGGEQ